MSGYEPEKLAITMSVESATVYDELWQAVRATDMVVFERDDTRKRLVVGGDLDALRRRLTKQGSAASAGGRDDLKSAVQRAKSVVRKQREELDR